MKRIIFLTLIAVVMQGGSFYAEAAMLQKKKKTAVQKKIDEKQLARQRKAAEKKFNRQLNRLVDTVVRYIPANGKKTVIALPNFDRHNDDRYQRNFNYAFLDMLNTRIRKNKKCRVLERESIDDILYILDLDTKGLYDSKKEAALGKMVDADYIILGQLKASKDESKEYVKIKVIDVRRQRTLSERKAELDRSMLYKTSSSFLIRRDSYDYIPPYLRFMVGMEYYQHVTTTHFSGQAGDLGFNLGLVFDLNKTHSFQVLTNVIFNLAGMYEYDNRTIEDDLSQGGTTSNVVSSIDFTTSIEYQMGYGFIFKPFRLVYVRPSFFLGYSYIQYNYKHLYVAQAIDGIGDGTVIYPTDGSLKKMDSATSYLMNATVDFLFNYNSRFSYYVSFGYKFIFSIFQDTWSASGQGGTYDAILSGVTMRGGVSFYL